jgi:hypothetical protein
MQLNALNLQKILPALLFLAGLIVFSIHKYPHLSVPFFMDETGVYGRMIFELAEAGLSMHPASIDMWISRGHPLLYPNMIALFCQIFGDTVFVAHASNFAIACLMVLSMYYGLSKLFHPWVGFTATALLMIQPIFYTQSVMVLPEVALAFFLWWTTWAFIERKYMIYILAGSAAVLTKEPAVIWIGALCVWELVHHRRGMTWKYMFWLFPFLTFGFFLLIQKSVHGWYFFPFHTGGFDFTFNAIRMRARDYLEYLFWEESRFIWLGIGIAGVLLAKNKRRKLSGPVITRRIYAVLFAVLVYFVFSCTTFFSERYLIPLLPFLCSMVAVALYYFILLQKPLWILPVIGLMGFLSFAFHMTPENFGYDNHMGYLRTIESYKKTIRYMLDHSMLETESFSANMPIQFAITDPRYGYLPPGVYSRYSRPIRPGIQYAVKVTPGSELDNPDSLPLELIAEWNEGQVKTSIYKVIQPDTIQIR